MFAVGHLAMGYLIGKACSEAFGLGASVPLILVFSVLPDIDLLIPFVEHRGPTHSVIVIPLISSLFLLVYGRTVTPYLLAVAQHVLGDVPSGGTQLLWPLNQEWYGLKSCPASPFNTTIEWILFLTSFILMLKTRDMHDFFKPQRLNFTLIIPAIVISLPLFTGFPIRVPAELIIPHLAYLLVFSFSILRDIRHSG